MEKCKKINGNIKPCASLERWIDGKVLRVCEINNRNMDKIGEMLLLHSGLVAKKRKKGVVVNFCPFCGSPVV